MTEATTELHNLDSRVMGTIVPMSVVLPPGFQKGQELPLLINLHGGGGDRSFLIGALPIWQAMWDAGDLPSLVMVSFSSGPGSWYGGAWEQFVTDELPKWANDNYGASLDPARTVMTGVSMGGYGSLKIGLKNPTRFRAIAPMEPAIEPSLTRTPGFKRNTWYRMPAMEAHRFLAAALAGGLDEPIDLPLNAEEEAYFNWVNGGGMATGEPPPSELNMMADPKRAPGIHRHIWDPLRDAADDPTMDRAYAALPPTTT